MSSYSISCFYLSLVLQICGLFFFFIGFLPVSPISKYQGDASSKTCNMKALAQNITHIEDRVVGKKLVLMVVDALREDFVFKGNRMPFLQRLIKDKKTISFLSKSYPPTVTLPRIKAMVTGTVPGFIDVVMNFASTELKEDNIILKLHLMGKKINFFGDETWLKLFPNCFMRHDGTTSFVVSDYKEVDDNVTRHLPYELSRNDWDVLILHFLGLDHIGHSAGPTSPLIGPKLLEMDHIVQEIIEALMKSHTDFNQDSLFVLTSDHGMNDAGSHGGASKPEIMTPLVFTSPSMMYGKGEYFTRKLVNQVDLAPSIAAIFNADIPENSVGTVIVDLLKFLPDEARKEQIRRNICQLSKQSSSVESLIGYCNMNQTSLSNSTPEFLTGILRDSSLHLQKQSSEYQIDKMNFGLVFLCLSFVFTLITLKTCTFSALDLWFGLVILLHSLLITSTSYIEEEHQFWYFVITTSIIVVFSLDWHISLTTLPEDTRMSTKDVMLSYKCTVPYLLILLTFRVARAWNQSGIKWLDQPDISSFLLLGNNRRLLITLIFISLVLILYCYFWKTSKFYRTVSAVALSFVFIHKVIALKGSTVWPFSFNGIVEARIVFAGCIFMLFNSIISSNTNAWQRTRIISVLLKFLSNSSYVDDKLAAKVTSTGTNPRESNKDTANNTPESRECYKEGYFHALLLLYITLQRPHNIVWLCLITIIERMLNYIRCQRFPSRDVDVSLVILHYCLGKASFHAQGHSNSLACVDISAAFIGINHYSPLLSGFLTSIATYGSHVFWFLSLKRFASRNQAQSNENKWTIRYTYNAILSLESIILCLVTYLNRYHLFIWSVFAPKFLFLVTFRLFMSVVILIY